MRKIRKRVMRQRNLAFDFPGSRLARLPLAKKGIASLLLLSVLAACGQSAPSSPSSPVVRGSKVPIMPPSSATLGDNLAALQANAGLKSQAVVTSAFCDDFNTFDTARWNTYTTPGYWGFYNTSGTYEAANTTVENGHLVLKLNYVSGDVASTTSPAVYQSAVVQSLDRMGYGTYETWVRAANTSNVPATNGSQVKGTFSLINNHMEYDYADAYTKPDTLIESKYGYGTANDLIFSTYKTNQPETTTQVTTPQNLSQGFHLQRWEWSPTALKFYVDGVLVHSITDPNVIPSEAANVFFNIWPVNKVDWSMPGSNATRYTMVDKFCFTPQAAPPPALVADVDIALDAPVFTLGDTQTFDGSGAGGSNYQWNFGDGQTATGETVTHQYATSGSYAVTLSYTNASGQPRQVQTQVSAVKPFHQAIPNRSLDNNRTVTWDLGDPLPGMGYSVTLGNGTVSNQSRGSYTYPKIGTYIVDLAVTDNRSQNVSGQGLRAQSVTPKVILRDQTWVTSWVRAPQAKFTMNSQNGADNPIAIGTLPHTVQFNAGGSQDTNIPANPLTYTWDFGDGTTATGIQTQKTYTTEGRYLVTLTVENQQGLKDTYRAFVHANDIRANVRLNVENSVLAAASLNEPSPIRTQSLRQQDVVTEVKQFFPYVLPSTNRVKNGIFRVRNSSGTIINTYCNTLSVYLNGAERYGMKIEKTELGQDPYTGEYYFCDGLIYQTGTIGRIPVKTINEVLQTSSQYLNSIRISTLQSLAVPRVTVSVFPDEYLPGEQASPLLNEYTFVNEDNGKTEWLLNVRIRQSEVKNGEVTFKVPTMALDVDGKFLTTVNGRFNARFTNTQFSSDCGDCLMVNGRGSITVRMPLNSFTVGQNALDFTTITVGTDNGCELVGSAVGYYSLANCASVATSYNYPTGNAPAIAAYAYPAHAKFLGHLVFGETAQAVADFRTYTQEGFYDDLKNYVLGPIPFIGSGRDFMEAVNALKENGVSRSTVASTFLSSVGVVADVAPAVAVGYKTLFKSFKLSKLGTGEAAKVLEQDTVERISSTALPSDIFDALKTDYGRSANLVRDCGQYCSDKLEEAITDLKLYTSDSKQAFKSIDNELGTAERLGVDKTCFIGAVADNVGAYEIEDIGYTFFDFGRKSLEGLSLRAQASTVGNCSYTELKKRSKAVYSSKYTSIPDQELDQLTPHHIVPLKEWQAAYCIDAGVNVCQEARDAIEGIIDINAGANAVLLKGSGVKPSKGGTAAFDQKFPNAPTHSRSVSSVHRPQYYSVVARLLKDVRKRYDADLSKLTPTQLQQLQTEMKSELERIHDAFLSGQILNL